MMSSVEQETINRDFISSGRLDGMVDSQIENLKLIQLNLKNDSLYQIIDNEFPDLELFNGPASYHRIVPDYGLIQIQEFLSLDYLFIISDNYQPPNDSRLYWTETKQGNNPYGT